MSGAIKKGEDGKFYITWEDYKKVHNDFKGTYEGSRSLLVYDTGTCLVVEGFGLVIEGAPKRKGKKTLI